MKQSNKDIICPHCNKAFHIDEAGYASILKQVYDEEFQRKLNQELFKLEKEKKLDLEIIEKKSINKIQAIIAEKNIEIQRLEAEKKINENSIQHKVNKAVIDIERERDTLLSNLEYVKVKNKLSETALKDKYENRIKDRDDAIDRLKDMKAKLSTKMVGETLEQHCEIEFERLRSSAFRTAFFEKDNDTKTGSKGDYIFKDFDENKNEIISVMFEMKNESDTTATKSKNEDFFKELDKDRNEKGCEYAVLVSMLETDSELYNTGIVDVFHKYSKMYVIRPQFFIPIITILRNAAMHSIEYKSELIKVKEQNIDITNFELELDKFKSSFSKNYELASRRFSKAIEEIDKSINHLQKTKEALLNTNRNLKIANDKAKDVNIKRLTKNNPTMAKKFLDEKNNK